MLTQKREFLIVTVTKAETELKHSMHVSNAIYSILINTQIKEIIASEDTLLDVSTMKFN